MSVRDSSWILKREKERADMRSAAARAWLQHLAVTVALVGIVAAMITVAWLEVTGHLPAHKPDPLMSEYDPAWLGLFMLAVLVVVLLQVAAQVRVVRYALLASVIMGTVTMLAVADSPLVDPDELNIYQYLRTLLLR